MKTGFSVILAAGLVGCCTSFFVPVSKEAPPAVAAIWNEPMPSLQFDQATWGEVVEVLDEFAADKSGGKVHVRLTPWSGPKEGGPGRISYEAKYIPFGEAVRVLSMLAYNHVRYQGTTIQFVPYGGIVAENSKHLIIEENSNQTGGR